MPGRRAIDAVDFLVKIQPGGEEATPELESIEFRSEPVTGFESLPPGKKQAVEGALGKLHVPETMDLDEQDALEAIIIPDRRPAIAIQNDDYEIAERDWAHLNNPEYKERIKPCIPSIGRIEIPEHPQVPFAGTGFLVGPNLLMTNRHVAELFVDGLGASGLIFRSGLSSSINFVREALREGDRDFTIEKALVVHPYWDMALLQVRGLDGDGLKPLTLARDADETGMADVVVIGYPAFDPRRNDVDVQRRVFNNLFDVKRLQPGKLLPRRDVQSFGKAVEVLTHDSSTLGGASGSAVIDARTGKVVALHFGGRYLQTNYAVPASDLALDARIADFGLQFESADTIAANRPDRWTRYWQPIETPESASNAVGVRARLSAPKTQAQQAHAVTANAPYPHGTWTIPLVITLQPGAPTPGINAPSTELPEVSGQLEALVEPWHDTRYERKGYLENFLGTMVPLPVPINSEVVAKLEDGSHVVPYMHFSIAMHRKRRLAVFAASNVRVDPAVKRPDPTRSYTRDELAGLGEKDYEKWFTDPRLRGTEQLPDKFFTKDRTAFDKGHLVRREDVAWGTSYNELRIANGDTYHVTNCSPQVAGFNRSDGITNWGELEKAVLAQAVGQRISVFAGPILDDADPDFQGVDGEGAVRVKIPRAFWKVVIAPDGGGLGAYGFLLEQDLSDVAMERLEFEQKWTPFMRPLKELERRIRLLTFPEILHQSDRFGSPAAAAVRRRARL